MMTHAPAVNYDDLSAPTLLLAGGNDRLIPPHATLELAKHIRGTRSEELSGLPHVGVLEAPKRIAASLRSFLIDR